MPAIAISYRRSDTAGVTGRIYDRLSEHFGADSVFMDIEAIPYGTDFRTHISGVLSKADVVLVIVGQRWLGERGKGRRIDNPNDQVRIEVALALSRSIPVIPVLVDHAEMPSPESLPLDLKDFAFRNAAEVDVGRDFKMHVDRLIKSLDLLGRCLQPGTGFSEEMVADRADHGEPVRGRGSLLDGIVRSDIQLRQPPDVPNLRPTDVHAAEEFGGYSRSSTEGFEGAFFLYRWSFSRPNTVFRGVVEIGWDEEKQRLVFFEHYKEGPSELKAHTGNVHISTYTGLVHLMTLDRGAIRLMTLTRLKNNDRAMRGFVATQSDEPAFFRPTVSTVVLRKAVEFDRAKLASYIEIIGPDAIDLALAREQLALTEKEVVKLRSGVLSDAPPADPSVGRLLAIPSPPRSAPRRSARRRTSTG